MKKAFIVGFIVVLAFSGCETNSERNPQVSTVSQAKSLRDGTYVKITGTIDSSLFGEWYTFSDSSGSISVEIDNELWVRNGINPTSLVFPASFEIVGEVDKERQQETVIEVESLRKL